MTKFNKQYFIFEIVFQRYSQYNDDKLCLGLPARKTSHLPQICQVLWSMPEPVPTRKDLVKSGISGCWVWLILSMPTNQRVIAKAITVACQKNAPTIRHYLKLQPYFVVTIFFNIGEKELVEPLAHIVQCSRAGEGGSNPSLQTCKEMFIYVATICCSSKQL